MSTSQSKTSDLISRDRPCEQIHVTKLTRKEPQSAGEKCQSQCVCLRPWEVCGLSSWRSLGKRGLGHRATKGVNNQARRRQSTKGTARLCICSLRTSDAFSFRPLGSLLRMTGKERNVNLDWVARKKKLLCSRPTVTK